jgi:hypothetical protein
MMYGNKLAAAIKVNGKVLREFKDTVYVPFGSEYAITVRNLHTTRAVVSVYIDGDNVVPGGLVLNAGQSIDLERSIRNNNLTEGNRFKFIERTENIENHRGIGVEDGLVRIEYQFEQVYRPVISSPWISASGSSGQIYPQGGIMRGYNNSTGEWAGPAGSVTCSASYDATSVNSSHALLNSVSDAGITVPGSKSTQSFSTTYVGALESECHSLVFKLVGDLGQNKPVRKPVTVKHKPKCVTCGKQNKATAKFCAECGTALEIFA